eukprot:10454932-Alexandrium_andersonii.AAC.1
MRLTYPARQGRSEPRGLGAVLRPLGAEASALVGTPALPRLVPAPRVLRALMRALRRQSRACFARVMLSTG